jgi:ribonucleoside-triphosphate reductase
MKRRLVERMTYDDYSVDYPPYVIIDTPEDGGQWFVFYNIDGGEVLTYICAKDEDTAYRKGEELAAGDGFNRAEDLTIELANEEDLEALEELVKFIYDNIQYAEFNTKSDYCHECGFDGEIKINDDLEWECPSCGNKEQRKMNVTRRTCGYLGENFWNVGKTKEIKSRVLHL